MTAFPIDAIFPAFNLLSRAHLKLKERPLLIMDVTVTRKVYMGLDVFDGSALSAMREIKDKCKLFNGLFTLLWHNTGFVNSHEIDLYRQIICS